MRITKISKTKGRTINTGDFNSVRFEESIEVELGEDDSVDSVETIVSDTLDRFLARDVQRLRDARKPKES